MTLTAKHYQVGHSIVRDITINMMTDNVIKPNSILSTTDNTSFVSFNDFFKIAAIPGLGMGASSTFPRFLKTSWAKSFRVWARVFFKGNTTINTKTSVFLFVIGMLNVFGLSLSAGRA